MADNGTCEHPDCTYRAQWTVIAGGGSQRSCARHLSFTCWHLTDESNAGDQLTLTPVGQRKDYLRGT